MNETPFQIRASKEGNVAYIRIVGTIGWAVDSESFRREVDALVADGCTEAHLYINSGGGSCFDAEEIVNILHSAFGNRITGEGGAIVASAATYISTHCKRFEMPENGKYMVHRPTSCVCGNVHDIAAGLKLLRSVEDSYFKTYEALATDKEDFKKKWEAGDNWMTAQEAKEAGFITHVRDAVRIDRETQDMIQACMRNEPSKINNKSNESMDVRRLALSLGLVESATEAEINAEIEKGRNAVTELAELKEQLVAKEEIEKRSKISEAIERAIKEKRIQADSRPQWEVMLNANLEDGLKALEALQPVAKLSEEIKEPKGSIGEPKRYNGKTFEELQDEAPAVLKDLLANHPEVYDEIYNDYLKRNRLN